ncbi:MAG: UDP-3-O-acyl-N-acetylglucosamine deacetylase, partial [Acidobacteriota bacterium]|nr:UDP-3-O-acyl-N-acetylglucosamine deacetylase [Acidobacteriota bacterium]
VSYATTLMRKGVMISTVEHILSALYGLGIDNLYLDLDAMEAPILDGSCACYVEKILNGSQTDQANHADQTNQTNIVEQDALRRYLVIEKPIEVRQGDKFAGVYPIGAACTPQATYLIEFDHPAIGRQRIDMKLTPTTFRCELAQARTFGFVSDIEYLKSLGLIRGGALDNAVVLDHDGTLNQRLRYPDEFVRHKLLDLLGDIALVGHPIIGHLRAERAGHAIHTALAEQILRHPSHCQICAADELEDILRAAG